MNPNWRAVLLVVAGALAACGSVSAERLEIHCLNIGHGDGTLVISPTGRTVLIDAGYDSLGLTKVLPWLDSLGITSLDWVVATHYHGDHIGGLDEVIEGLGLDSIKQGVLDRSWSYSTNMYDDYARAAGAKRRTFLENETLDLGGGATITALGLNGNHRLRSPYTDPPWSENDLCIALRVSYGRFDFSISGDLSGDSTEFYRDIETSVAAEVGPVEVLHVNHHGSRYSSNPFFLATLGPLASVISCGENDYGHPHAETVDRLRAYGPIYQTADRRGRVVDGDVIITTDGTDFIVEDDTFACKVGVEEGDEGRPPRLKDEGGRMNQTVVRGRLVLPELGTRSELPGRNSVMSRAVLVDASGRRVMSLAPGGNDVSHLAPGVYFVLPREPGVVRRFVVVR